MRPHKYGMCTLTGSGIDTAAPSAPAWEPQTVTFPSALTVDQAGAHGQARTARGHGCCSGASD